MAEMINRIPSPGETYSNAKNMVIHQGEAYVVVFEYDPSGGGGWYVVLVWDGFGDVWVETYRINTTHGELTDAMLYVAPYQVSPGLYENRIFLIVNRTRTLNEESFKIEGVGSIVILLGYGGYDEIYRRELQFEFTAKCQPTVYQDIGQGYSEVYFACTYVTKSGLQYFANHAIVKISPYDDYYSCTHILDLFLNVPGDGATYPIAFIRIDSTVSVIINNQTQASKKFNLHNFELIKSWATYTGSQSGEEVTSAIAYNGVIYAATTVLNIITDTLNEVWDVLINSGMSVNEVYHVPFLYIDNSELFLVNFDGNDVNNFVYKVENTLVEVCPTLDVMPGWYYGAWQGSGVVQGVTYLFEENCNLVYVTADPAEFYLWPFAIFGAYVPDTISYLSTFGYVRFDVNSPVDLSDYLNLYIEQFKHKPDLLFYTNLFLKEMEELLINFYHIEHFRNLDISTKKELEINGLIVGATNDAGLSDTDFLKEIQYKAALNVSGGEAEMLITLFKKIVEPVSMHITDLPPAKILISYQSINPPSDILKVQLKTVLAGGVGLRLSWTNDDFPDFSFEGEGEYPPAENTDGFGEVGQDVGGAFVEYIL